MRSAYDETGLYNLAVIKETKRWWKQHFIEKEQFEAIQKAYPAPFYHPNFIIRVLLFVAGLFALFGVSGILWLILEDGGEEVVSAGFIMTGLASAVIVDRVFIKNYHHYKSGVTEALLYYACITVISGLLVITEANMHVVLLICVAVLAFVAVRYIDLVCTLAALASFAGLLFYECYEIGGIVRQIIPFVFIGVFSAGYFFVLKIKNQVSARPWYNSLVLLEALCLLLVYAAGNYLVVRELSVALMNLWLEPGQDIPFAFVFYTLTVLIPLLYLYFGIKNKNVVLLRVSLVAIAFAVFTFKYYYSLGHPEITFTIAGALLIIVSVALMNYLKIMRNGYTRENILTEKWANTNAQAFIVSQTMGGNQPAINTQTGFKGGGGEFGGGGASGSY